MMQALLICRWPLEAQGSATTWHVLTQHRHAQAVTFCAGLACEGLVPFAAIYSSFLQRGYDQVVHDVCLQKLPGVQAMPPSARTACNPSFAASM
jgi:hypothetical protein